MKSTVIVLLFIHGLIHLIGFVTAFNLAVVDRLKQPVTPFFGVLWLAATLLFCLAAFLLLFHNSLWWLPLGIAILLSQFLILGDWQDARVGTVANVVLVFVTVVGYGTWSYSNKYRNEVNYYLTSQAAIANTLLTEAVRLALLPGTVQKYLRYTQCVNKPRVNNFRITFTGQIRKNAQSEWMPFTSEQYNFVHASARLFFMNAVMKHLPVAGFHCFKNGAAFMDIRLFSLFRVQFQAGKEMDTAETVTFFNDMCCMAPATLIDDRIKWLQADSNKVTAAFTNNGITIKADLYFNETGQLVNFISEDRYAAGDGGTMQRLRWSTPLKNYREFHGYRLASYADAIYSYPSGDLTYGTFATTDVVYNCK